MPMFEPLVIGSAHGWLLRLGVWSFLHAPTRVLREAGASLAGSRSSGPRGIGATGAAELSRADASHPSRRRASSGQPPKANAVRPDAELALATRAEWTGTPGRGSASAPDRRQPCDLLRRVEAVALGIPPSQAIVRPAQPEAQLKRRRLASP